MDQDPAFGQFEENNVEKQSISEEGFEEFGHFEEGGSPKLNQDDLNELAKE